MKKKVAIVGFGFMGRMHYGIWKKIKGAEVAALCDKDTSQFTTVVTGGNVKGADTSTDYGKAAIHDDFDRMLAEVKPDVVSITLPTPLHVPLTVKALNAGVSVLCEKPMALTAKDCRTMLAAARKAPNGAKLMIAHCLRFWPCYVYLKKLVQSGKYGKVLGGTFNRMSPAPGWSKGKNWMLDEAKSGGVALDLHIHDTDIIQHLFGLPADVTSKASFDANGTMMHISTIYGYGNMAVTSTGCWTMPQSLGFEANYFVTFEKAVVVLDAKRAKPLMVYPAKGEAFEPKLPAGEGYEFEIKWFMDVLSGKKTEPVITPEDSYQSVRIVDAEKKSARTGKTVKI